MDSPIIVDLLRHGRTERENIFRGRVDDPLTEQGWQQMENAVEQDTWGRIVSSPLSRCERFARNLAESQEAAFRIDHRLAEYDFGDWDGRTYDEILESQSDLVNAFFSEPDKVTPPNAESYTDFRQRVVNFWEELLESAEPGEQLLVVGHGGVIVVMLAHILGVGYLHGKIDVPYASRSRIQVGQGGAFPRLVFHR